MTDAQIEQLRDEYEQIAARLFDEIASVGRDGLEDAYWALHHAHTGDQRAEEIASEDAKWDAYFCKLDRGDYD